MIDYIPPDIPPAIVKFADEHYKKPPEDAVGKYYKFLCVWKGNFEIYIMKWRYKSLGLDETGQPILRYTGLPTIFLYDCHDIKKPTLEEIRDIHYFMHRYTSGNLQSEHLCHRDLEAFKNYKTPNPYKHKPKYITPKYVPKAVIGYINKKYPTSWYPGLNTRYTKYMATYENKYEVYLVYWTNPKTQDHSDGKYILYDCENIREYKDNKERIDLIFLKPEKYNSNDKPTYCSAKKKLFKKNKKLQQIINFV